jgi:Spy/CpxP family protein refolding chaperone
MSMKMIRMAGLGLLLAASPVLAQMPPPPADAPMMRGDGPGGMGQRMFSSLSEAGRATMREAMRPAELRTRAEQVRAARDKMLAILEADRLDTAALKKAMDEERAIADASHERRQAAMIAGFTKLSVQDRKAFVTEARQMREKMQQRMGERMKRWRERRGATEG